ncbi:MAG TPA: hypothetical protein VFE37_05945 [Chloroflexota bacterium]|nr:hypothetical protein [Chloroflexota bacterium]
MRSRERWVVLALLAILLVVAGRRFLRIADPDASLYAAPPSRR